MNIEPNQWISQNTKSPNEKLVGSVIYTIPRKLFSQKPFALYVEMIPMKFLSKMGLYNIPIQGSTVTVHVVDNPDVVYTGVCELRAQIGTKTAVGLVVKHDTSTIKLLNN